MASLIGQPAAAQGDGQLVLEPKSCQRSRMMNKLKQQPNQGPCARVVIEQVDGNYITISFLARGSERGSSNSLSLGGTTTTPLSCRLNKCRLSQPLKLELDNAKDGLRQRRKRELAPQRLASRGQLSAEPRGRQLLSALDVSSQLERPSDVLKRPYCWESPSPYQASPSCQRSSGPSELATTLRFCPWRL